MISDTSAKVEHARGAADAFDDRSRELVGYCPTGEEVLSWFAEADMVVVLQVRLRWLADHLTDPRTSASDRLSIVANHPFWKPYLDPERERRT